jgi:hypothetical protein
MRFTRFTRILLTLAFAVLMTGAAFGQGSAFSFQGRLNDGANPANGRYDLQFRLYNALAGGTQIGAEVSRPNTILINGVFSTTLDFGAAAFNNPNNVFIEIAVKPNGSPSAYTILGPRQQLTAVPFAIRALNATNADIALNAVNAGTAVNATNAENATNSSNANTAINALNLGGVAPSGWTRLNVQNTGSLMTTGSLQITGNATQSSTSSGLIKAMLTVNSNGTIERCYNGVTNSSTGNCGFAITMPLSGVFRIDFGFPVAERFVSVTAQYCSGCFNGATNNIGANYRIFSSTSYEVFTFQSGSADTTSRNFTLILY